jgi:hypothetical protein
MGKREARQTLKTVLKLCGHREGGPTGVSDQSMARISAPISPPPANTCSISDVPSGFITDAAPLLLGNPHLAEVKDSIIYYNKQAIKSAFIFPNFWVKSLKLSQKQVNQ